MCQDILTVIVGSRLHGLSSAHSDTDFRGVFVNDIAAIVNPFEKPEEKRFIEGRGKDDTASELRKFVKEVVAGNPNSVEVLFSNAIDNDRTTEWGWIIHDNAFQFIDTANVFNAFKNYSANQLNKMSLFDPDVRTPKFAVAYIRSLLNGVELLRDGTITNPVPELFTLSDGTELAPREVLKAIKFCPFEEFDAVRGMAMELFALLQVELARVFYSQKPRVANTEWIVQLCREVYGV